MSATPEPSAKPEGDKSKIEINVAFPNEAALTFRVKRTTPFGKIYDSIAAQKDINVNSFSLSYDGERITREANPKMLEMSDGDQIDVQLAQVGGRQEPKGSQTMNRR